jgi:hypothetical protein
VIDRKARDMADRRGSDAAAMARGQEERDVGAARFGQGVPGVAPAEDTGMRFDLCRAQQRDAAFCDRLGLPPIEGPGEKFPVSVRPEARRGKA